MHADAELESLVSAFEAAVVVPSQFNHRAHLRVAWSYLSKMPLADAHHRYVHHLRKLTVALGVPQKFDADVTRRYFELLDEAMRRHPGTSFDALVTAEPRLLQRPG